MKNSDSFNNEILADDELGCLLGGCCNNPWPPPGGGG